MLRTIVIGLGLLFPLAAAAQEKPVVGVAAIEVAAQNISCDARGSRIARKLWRKGFV